MLIEQGNLDEAQSLYDDALKSFTEALNLYSKTENTAGMVEAHLRIGKIHIAQGDYVSAAQSCTVGRQIAVGNGLIALHADALYQMGDIQSSWVITQRLWSIFNIPCRL